MDIASKYRLPRGLRLAVAVFALAALALSARLGASPPAAPAQQGSPLAPSLPASERFVYARSIGDKLDQVAVDIRLVSSKGQAWYELSSRSADQDAVFRLDPKTLFASYMDITTRGPDSTIRRVTTVLENRGAVGPDEYLVSSADSLPYTLRAFPWGSRQKAKVSFLGAGMGRGGMDFRFDLGVTGKETLDVAGAPVECWKAQLSLGGIIGTFFGKSTLWYSVEYPHYLVKSSSSSAGPGSPASVLSLVSYSSDPQPK